MKASPIIIACASWALMLLGFALSFWPLGGIGIVLAALQGRFFSAIGIGLVLDIAYGAPTGTLHFLYIPFTFAAAVLCFLYYFFASNFREGDINTI